MTPRALYAPARLAGTPLLRTQSDERLVDLVRAGNDGAFEAIVARYRRQLLRYCSTILPGRPRGGCPPADLPAGLRRAAGLRGRDAAAALALPHRPQPVPERAARPLAGPRAARRDDRRGAAPRPGAGAQREAARRARRGERPARAPARRDRAARDGGAQLRRDRLRDGRDRRRRAPAAEPCPRDAPRRRDRAHALRAAHPHSLGDRGRRRR